MDAKRVKNITLFSGIFLSLFFAGGVFAASLGDVATFNVEQNFESSENSKVQSVLVKSAGNLHFYVEKKWWDGQVLPKQNEILAKLDVLETEFSQNIYPTLTSVYGPEWRPGVDGDSKITILFHSIKDGVTGYFRSADEYVKLQIPDSNEREMLYMSLAFIESQQLKVFLGHEFTHLIAFNQKDRLQDVQEEVWLNEARADYASTILGYDDIYEGSNLQHRAKTFLEKPTDQLTEWQDGKYDYAVVNIFMHYLVDHYGINILADSLKSKLVGIASINEMLLKNKYQEDFAQIFTNWTITAIINECSLDQKYCYLNKNLRSLRINPILNFLPLSGNSTLTVTNVTKNWSGNWQKIIGGNGNLTLKFESLTGLNFKIPYIIFDKNNRYTLKFLELGKDQKGEISIKDFGIEYTSLIIMPSLQSKNSFFNGFEPTYPYTFTASITGAVPEEDQEIVQRLLAQIEELKRQIEAIQKGGDQTPNEFCAVLNNNLYVGIRNIPEVKCLQQFLKSQG